jgi:hypothetical protein
MSKGIKGFQKGHPAYKGSEKGLFTSERAKKLGFQKGHGLINGGVKGKHWKMSKSKTKNMSRGKGENNPLWKGGTTRTKQSLFNPEYKLWRTSVFTRDNWKCKLKNSDCSSRLESHHIFNWKDYPELRYVINNGITLCKFHHPLGREKEKRMIPIFQELLLTKN